MANWKGEHESIVTDIIGPLLSLGMGCHCSPCPYPWCSLIQRLILQWGRPPSKACHIEEPAKTIGIYQNQHFLSLTKAHGTLSHCLEIWPSFTHKVRFMWSLQWKCVCLSSCFLWIFNLQKPLNCSLSYIYTKHIKKLFCTMWNMKHALYDFFARMVMKSLDPRPLWMHISHWLLDLLTPSEYNQ